VQSSAEGIGLLRTEFMLMNRDDIPSVQEQYDLLADVVRGMNGRAVTIRTFDIGADKQTPALTPYIGHEENPALGLRALRLSMAVPELLDNQLTAILRASALGKVRVLLPMVTHLSQVQFVRERLNTLQQQLIKRRVAVSREMLPLGIMVETPAAAIMADEFAAISEFLAIGTNDLVQYVLATDRGNDAVAHLSNPDHPAVTTLLRQVVAAGQKYQRPVSVCGEVAGDIDTVGHLLALGIRNLSMAASSIPSVKERIRKLDLRAESV
jgi:phosphoenolpyruvate-protein phosphotransferase (PTS system enzyme I)